MVLALALAALWAGPEIVLPKPTGPFAVGTSVRRLVDGARKDERFPAGRPIALQLWYPAAGSTGARAPYLIEAGLARVLAEQGYYEVEPERIAAWAELTTNSILDAKPAEEKHALLTFSVGLGVVRANYTTLAEELASHGYVFALVESPLAGLMVLPDGTVVQDTSNDLETSAGHRAAVDAWARDVTFVLDRLSARDLGGVADALAATIDWKRVGALGHSSGGLVAVQLASTDARVRAAIDLDGGLATPEGEPLARLVEAGPTKPTLILRSHPLYGDEDFQRRGITREQWEARGAAGKKALEELAQRSRAPLVIAGVAGTGHFSFSDAPFVMPAAITRFGGKIIEPERGRLVITGAIRAFFEDHLAPQPGQAFEALVRTYPELEIEARSTSDR
jgi:dienelactone hydrolase